MFNFDGPTKPVVREEFKGRVGWIEAASSSFTEQEFSPLAVQGDVTLRLCNGHSQSKSHQVAKDTEVVPMVYEGGFKIWECSFDIIHSLTSLSNTDNGLRILDLGCGAGVVGIWCLLRFPQATVVFHDLNDTVLEQVTIPNCSANGVLDRAKFCCGPWHLARDLGKYDLILSADTMYSLDALPDLIDILLRTLASPNSRAVLAAKRYYFGVGGGSSSFLELARSSPAATACVLTSVADGASNIRDVVEFKLSNN
ncbi:hypothetical protein BASA81_013821 [Batrachochytrium salamandrivorans]|nr:hypothetical protein BASA81_013821 [Batrachochytrium salamandrivorans]